MAGPSSLDDLSVKQIMDQWPDTVAVFVAHRMHCVGCPIGPFHTLGDAAIEHGLSLPALERAVAETIKAGRAPGRRRSAAGDADS